MNEKLTGFINIIVKYGGVNLVIFLAASWYFDTYFHVDPEEVTNLLGNMLQMIFWETIFVMIVSRLIWAANEVKKFIKGEETKIVETTMNGKSVSALAKDVGLDLAASAIERLRTTPEAKERKLLKKDIKNKIKQIEKEIKAIE